MKVFLSQIHQESRRKKCWKGRIGKVELEKIYEVNPSAHSPATGPLARGCSCYIEVEPLPICGPENKDIEPITEYGDDCRMWNFDMEMA